MQTDTSFFVGSFEIVWEQETSTDDSAATFNLPSAFSNTYLWIAVNLLTPNENGQFSAASFLPTGFVIERHNAEFDGDHDFSYIAIGY